MLPRFHKWVNGVSGAVGNTPLIRLNRLSKETGCDILGKAEFMQPGGSVKDRAALYILQDAERKGLLKQGGTVVEGTAGNTGIGLAHLCRQRNYQLIIYMPDTQSQEKMDLLRMLGADVRPVPAVPYENPMNYNHQAQKHAEALDNAVWTNQFDNRANRQAHYETTGPEVYQQCGEGVDGFVCATGTGGTLAGVTRYLKEKLSGRVECWLADPPGSILYDVKMTGVIGARSGSSITEGIGQGRVTENLRTEMDMLDNAIRIDDADTIAMVYRLLDEEGLYLGASSALNVVAAVKMAQSIGPGKRIVTILCDGAYRYQSRLFSKTWLEAKGLLDCIPSHLGKYIVLP